MKYSFPNHSNKNSSDTNHPNSYQSTNRQNHHVPAYETVKATELNQSIREPLANPVPPFASNQTNHLTKPKVTYPVNSFYAQQEFQPAEIIYEDNNVHASDTDNYVVSMTDTYAEPVINNYGYGVVANEFAQSIFHTPAGVSLTSLYGYDSYEDSEKDYDYMKQLFPIDAKKILIEVIEECDKLEYEGSCMFDEYPDRVYLGRIIDKIYDKTKHLFEDSIHVAEFEESYARRGGRRPERRPAGRNNPIKDIIEVLFYNEILNRRRRYRGRRQWY